MTSKNWAAAWVALSMSIAAHAQSVVGQIDTNIPLSMPLSFECTGNPCVGTYRGSFRPRNCTNSVSLTGSITVSGMLVPFVGGGAIGAVGSAKINAKATLANAEITPVPKPDGTCSFPPGKAYVQSFSGRWDGFDGRLSALDKDNTGKEITVSLTYHTRPIAPFKMSVNADVNDTIANASASVDFDASIVGTTQNVYVFAVAPAGVAKRASIGKANASAACTLAQLNNAGQLVAVSGASLQPYASGTIQAATQSYPVLTNVPSANVAGATFMIGVGQTASAAITEAAARAVVTVPASNACKAERPQTGWWWNPAEGGRGFSIEERSGNLFLAGFLYDQSGQATWLAATGPVVLEGSVFQAELLAFANGQPMSGPYRSPTTQPSPGPITLTFSDATHGVLSWPGGNVDIERFDVVPEGRFLNPDPNQPDSGWWWNENESGRGYFIEWQGSNAFLATYLYTPSGAPVWYASQAATPDISRFEGPLLQYAGGQTLTGTYRPPTGSASIGNIAVTFTGTDTATLTWPGGTQVPIKRFRF